MLTFIHVEPVASRALSRHCSVAVRQKRVHPRALIIPRFSDSPMELHSLGILDHVLQRFFLLPFYFHLFFFLDTSEDSFSSIVIENFRFIRIDFNFNSRMEKNRRHFRRR